MSNLEDAVDAAYEKAQTSINPDDWAVYHALNAALNLPPAPGELPSTEGLPTPEEAGFPSELHIEKPDPPSEP